jgi:hypothetical protein
MRDLGLDPIGGLVVAVAAGALLGRDQRLLHRAAEHHPVHRDARDPLRLPRLRRLPDELAPVRLPAGDPRNSASPRSGRSRCRSWSSGHRGRGACRADPHRLRPAGLRRRQRSGGRAQGGAAGRLGQGAGLRDLGRLRRPRRVRDDRADRAARRGLRRGPRVRRDRGRRPRRREPLRRGRDGDRRGRGRDPDPDSPHRPRLHRRQPLPPADPARRYHLCRGADRLAPH